MRVLQLNPDYELAWRGLANVLFLRHTGLDLGYGYCGRVDDTNAADVLDHHATPEHLAQLMIARKLRASVVGVDAERSGARTPERSGASGEDVMTAFVRRVASWYGGMAGHVYGAHSRHYRRNKRAVAELAATANALLQEGVCAEGGDDEAETAVIADAYLALEQRFLGQSRRKLSAWLRDTLAIPGASVLDFATLEVESLGERTAEDGGDCTSGSASFQELLPELSDRALLEPPPLDARVGSSRKRRRRVELGLPDGAEEQIEAAFARGAELVMLRAAEEGQEDLFMFAVPDSRVAWIERDMAREVLFGALNSKLPREVVAAVFALPKEIVRYFARALGGSGSGGPPPPPSAAAGAGAGSGSGSAQEQEEQQQEEQQQQPPQAQEEPQEEQELQVHQEEQPEEATQPPQQQPAPLPEQEQVPTLAEPVDVAELSPPRGKAVGCTDPAIWVRVTSSARADRAVDRALRRARRAGRCYELLRLSDEILLALLLAPDSHLRTDTWAALAEASQDALPSQGLLRIRAALGLLQAGTSDEELLGQRGRGGVVSMGGGFSEMWLPNRSDALTSASVLLAEFADRHKLLRHADGTHSASLAGKRGGKGYTSRPAAAEEVRAAEAVYLSEREAVSGEERLDAEQCLGIGVRAKSGSATDPPTPDHRPLRLGYARGIGFGGMDAWREVLRRGGEATQRALRQVLDEAEDAAPELRAELLDAAGADKDEHDDRSGASAPQRPFPGQE